jgi:hypothetical protein
MDLPISDLEKAAESFWALVSACEKQGGNPFLGFINPGPQRLNVKPYNCRVQGNILTTKG